MLPKRGRKPGPHGLLAKSLRRGDRILLLPNDSRGALLQVLRLNGLRWAEMSIPVHDLMPYVSAGPRTPDTLLWVLRADSAPDPDCVAEASSASRAAYKHLHSMQFVPRHGDEAEVEHPFYALFQWAKDLEYPQPQSLIQVPLSSPIPAQAITQMRVHDGMLLQNETESGKQSILSQINQQLGLDDWDAIVTPEGVQLWRLTGAALGGLKRPESAYRAIARRMRNGDSVLFPAQIARSAGPSLAHAVAVEHPMARPVRRTYPDRSVRLWVLYDDPAEPLNETPASSEGLNVRGHPVTIESGVPVIASMRNGGAVDPSLMFDDRGVIACDDRMHANRVYRALQRRFIPCRKVWDLDGNWFVKRLPIEPLTHLEPPSR